MPTIGVSSEISLSTKEARTTLHSFYKAISADSSTIKTLNLQPNASGSLSLTNSDFVLVIGLEDTLTITVINNNASSFIIENSGFLMLNASNLYSIEILNNNTEEQEISLVF